MNKHYISDAILLGSFSDTEDGLQVTAQLKKFNSVNLNGEQYASDAYDDFINDYYVKNGYEIPLTVQHSQHFDDIVGKIDKIEKNEDGLFVSATVFANLPKFQQIKTLLNAHILGGISDEGIAEGDFDAKTNIFNVKKAQILAVSLVTTPAEPLAKANVKETKNLITEGFTDSRKGINKLLKKQTK